MKDKETAWTAVKARVAEDLKLYHKVMEGRDTKERVTEPNKELTEALKSMLKPKAPEEIYKSVEGTGEKNNLTFSEAGLLKEVSSKKTKTERKRPEFTFEDGVDLAKSGNNLSGYLIATMVRTDVFGLRERLVTAIEYLRDTSYEDHYEHKPLRKKLKLYVKWLQSEMSKKESSK